MPFQAANLFERTVKGLTRALGRTEGGSGAMFSPAAGPKALAAAERALLALIASLDAWAGPLKVRRTAYSHTKGSHPRERRSSWFVRGKVFCEWRQHCSILEASEFH